MNTHFGSVRPGLLTALIKVAMIGTWRGRTFLDDNLELDDVAGFVPDQAAEPMRLPVGSTPINTQAATQPTASPGHSVAA
jgi:hypothetical protein